MSRIEEEDIQEEELPEEEELDDEPVKKTKPMFSREHDEATDNAAKSIFGKIYDIEEEEPEEDDHIQSVPMEDDEGKIPFNSEGREKGIVISPYDGSKKYSLVFVNEQGAVIRTISDLRGLYKAKVKFEQGNYSVIVKSKDNNLPFSAKIM